MTIKVDIRKKFHGFSLDASFTTDHKCTGILGQSGCGKSMILKCISGIITPDEGSIYIGDRLVFDSKSKINIPTRERNIGFLFQNYALFPNMNVEKNILSASKIKDERENQKELKKLLELFKIENIRKSMPRELSGGQAQRVAIARMIMQNPDIMLLDEPFSALDESLKLDLQIELYDLIKNSNKQTLIVTHSRDEVYRFCDYIVALDEGCISNIGTKNEVFDNPKSRTTAKLIGIKNIFEVENVINGKVKIKNIDFSFDIKGEKKPKYIGILAHDLKPIFQMEENSLSVEILQILEEPFERTLVLNIKNSNEKLIMAIPREFWKEEYRKIEFVKIDVEKIKLLD